MIYLDTKSLEIEYTKGRPTPKSEPAFSIPSPTPPTLKSDFQKKLRVAGCVFKNNKTYQYRYSSSSNNHLSNFSLLEGKASLYPWATASVSTSR